jgi:hypothetical protein
MKKIHSLALVSTVAAALCGSAQAYSNSRGDMSNYGTIRHEIGAREPAATENLVRINGILSCDLGSANTGQACELKLKENGSGRIYNLADSAAAMRLFQDGKKNVQIEGRLAGNETIEVKTAQTL